MSMERVCVLSPEIKVPVSVCVCIWAEKKKRTNRVMEGSSGW